MLSSCSTPDSEGRRSSVAELVSTLKGSKGRELSVTPEEDIGPWTKPKTPLPLGNGLCKLSEGDSRAKQVVEALAHGLSKLQDEGDDYTTRVEYEVKRREEHKQACKGLRQAIEKNLKELKGGSASTLAKASLKSSIRQLEHRIFIANKRKSQLDNQCKALKEKIDAERRDILYQSRREESLLQELTQKRVDVGRLVEDANEAYSRRGKAIDGIQQLEKKHKALSVEFEKEWNELKIIMSTKEDAYKKKLSRLKIGSPTATKEMETNIIEKFRQDEAKLKKAVIAGNWVAAKSRISTKLFNEKVHTFEEAFAKVQEMTGVSSLEDLAAHMARAEDENFRAFNHLADINNEINDVEVTIASLQQQIDENLNQTTIFSQFKRQVIMELQQKFNTANKETDELERNWEDYSDRVNILKPFVRDLFQLIDCSMFSVPDNVDLNDLSDGEMQHCLGVIEQRTNEIIHVFSCIASVARVKAKALDSYQTFHTSDVDIQTLGTVQHENSDNTLPLQRRRSSHWSNPGLGLTQHPSRFGVQKSTVRAAAIPGPQHPRGRAAISINPPAISKIEAHGSGDDDEYDMFGDGIGFETPIHRDELDQEWLMSQVT